jgi:hypothetical protein
MCHEISNAAALHIQQHLEELEVAIDSIASYILLKSFPDRL